MKSTTNGEILRLFGILEFLTRIEFTDRRSLWIGVSHGKRRKQVDLTHDMVRHRFEDLVASISFSGVTEAPEADRWIEVEGFIRAINEHRHSRLNPSAAISVVDSPRGGTVLEETGPRKGFRITSNSNEILKVAASLRPFFGDSGIILTIEVTKSAAGIWLRD